MRELVLKGKVHNFTANVYILKLHLVLRFFVSSFQFHESYRDGFRS